MASYSDPVSVHKVTAAGVADAVTIGTQGVLLRALKVSNRGGAPIYFTLSLSGRPPTTATSGGNGTLHVPGTDTTGREEAVEIDLRGKQASVCSLSLISAGSAYSVEGIRA